ncbi:hypothetical protein EON64_06670 [archaeon]|nr:MAG: hypothetical protein EON64_06670 [archaeon]
MFGKELLRSFDNNLWKSVFERYDDAVAVVSAKKNKPDLPQLDRFVFSELPNLIKSRNPGYLEHSDLSKFSPDLCIFMADEVIESANIVRNYDMKTYILVRDIYKEKARELGEGWDMQKVGQAVWTACILGAPTSDNNGEGKIRNEDQAEGEEAQMKKRRKLGK